MTAKGPLSLEIDLKIEAGEFVSIFGESGAGKTTVLRMIAGLTTPDEGTIETDTELWFDSARKINLPVQRRRIGFVFQDYSLFPHMSVRENLEFALQDKKEKAMIAELLEVVGLSELMHQRPNQLSGGQKQRVALIRALVRRPQLYLLDEPLSAVDLEWRLKLQEEILKIYRRFKTTTVFVSHDLSEVFKLSGRVFILERGRITKSGPPEQVFFKDNLSGKFKFAGETIEIKKADLINIVIVRVGNNLIKVVAADEEIAGLKTGDKVIVSAKAFNPLILKIE